jgi:hypothetical protein
MPSPSPSWCTMVLYWSTIISHSQIIFKLMARDAVKQPETTMTGSAYRCGSSWKFEVNGRNNQSARNTAFVDALLRQLPTAQLELISLLLGSTYPLRRFARHSVSTSLIPRCSCLGTHGDRQISYAGNPSKYCAKTSQSFN